jgi:hypothetical protein
MPRQTVTGRKGPNGSAIYTHCSYRAERNASLKSAVDMGRSPDRLECDSATNSEVNVGWSWVVGSHRKQEGQCKAPEIKKEI